MPETVARYFLDHYVTVCERFNYSTAESDYEECGAFHTPQRNQVWYAAWNKSNPLSPLNTFKDGTSGPCTGDVRELLQAQQRRH